MEVQQTGLDVELWMNETLQSELEARGFTFRSLTDYDVQMVEVGNSIVQRSVSLKFISDNYCIVRCVGRRETWCSLLW